MNFFKSIKQAVFLYLIFAIINSAQAVSYFGYYATALEGTGQYFNEVADHSNTFWITDYISTTTAIQDLRQAASMNKKVILDVSLVFLNGNQQLKPDWPTLWNNFADAIRFYQNSIIAFYPMDEPNLNKIPPATIATIVNAIRSQFPDKPIAVIYGDSADSSTMGYFDWIGFDCYSNGNFRCSKKNYMATYAELKSLIKSSQRIMLIPQVGLPKQNDGCCITSLSVENHLLYDLAYGDPQIIGIFPFIWESFSATSPQVPWYGLSRYPDLQQTVKAIGRNVISNWIYPTGMAPVYRFDKANLADFMHTRDLSPSLIPPPNPFNFSGIVFSVYTDPSMVPLYRCYTGATHFISTDVNCEGLRQEGILGYASPKQTSANTPLHRFNNPSTGAHLITVNYNEGARLSGFHYEGILAYVPVVNMP